MASNNSDHTIFWMNAWRLVDHDFRILFWFTLTIRLWKEEHTERKVGCQSENMKIKQSILQISNEMWAEFICCSERWPLEEKWTPDNDIIRISCQKHTMLTVAIMKPISLRFSKKNLEPSLEFLIFKLSSWGRDVHIEFSKQFK